MKRLTRTKVSKSTGLGQARRQVEGTEAEPRRRPGARTHATQSVQ